MVEKRNKTKNSTSKIIIGIDPGSTTIGYGVIKVEDHLLKPTVISYGYLDLGKKTNQAKKLVQLNDDLMTLFKKYKPNHVAVESLYYFKNLKTVIPVMQSRGVILFSAADFGSDIFEYTPLQVKQTISGYGRSDKKIIQKIVKSNLEIKSDIKPDDASDALAIALCHIRHMFS